MQEEINDIEDIFTIDIPDVGGIDAGDIDLSAFNIGDDYDEECRYIKPTLRPIREDYVTYENAQALAREIKIEKGSRYDVLLSGSFVFGDFIEAFLLHNRCKAKRLLITTLSLNQDNVDSFHNLLEKGWVDQLDLIVSDYFYSHERHGAIPYMYDRLDIDNKFQLAVAFVHTKTIQIETLGGKKIIMHGSANLRTSGNVEQMTIEENEQLYDFYEECFTRLINQYKTINKTAPRKAMWSEIDKMKFND